MKDDAERPDPDALLQRLHAEAARAGRGRLKIFFGFAPGVGKTYRMLQAARELVTEEGADVVVGVVETHGRFETAALLLGLEVLPRRSVPYRGRTLEEFDLDAALARKPRLVLLDELAHTNAPGLRHAKRHQDALELLDAGIDVFTTLNVQHIESLNDVVAQITHVRVRETVPDSVLDLADNIELVDIAPEELLVRLREGKVYFPEQAERAAEHFFRRGNLLALREIALRRTAQHVAADVEEYREEHGVSATWPTGERILCCAGPAPSSARLIRAAYRMAAGLRSPWTVVYVETPALGGTSAGDRERLESHLRLAESLGAAVTRLSGTSVAEAILTFAHRHNVTRIVIGKPTHPRWRDRLRGSLLDRIVRGSGDTEVHVISGDEDRERGSARPTARRPPPPLRAFGTAALLVAAVTGLSALARGLLDLPDVEMLYLLAVMVAAVRLGRWPSVFAAALGVAAYDFFFVPPHYTFAVSDVRYLLTFAMMFGVGFLLSELTVRLRRQVEAARAREERTTMLYALSRELGAAGEPPEIAAVACRHAAEVLEAEAFALLPGGAGGVETAAAAPGAGALDAGALAVARWVFEHGRAAGLGTDTLPDSPVLCIPLRLGAAAAGVLAVRPGPGAPLRSEQREYLDALARQVALALERARLAEEARAAALRARTEEMRSSLLSAVSHDLRTPLAAITGAATTLRDDSRLSAAARVDLLDAVCEEAERLERLVGNLLDMTRLESGAMTVKREWVPLEEIVGSALNRLDAPLAGRDVRVRIADAVPLVSADPVLFAQVFVNLLENAAKYTPPGSPIEIAARPAEGAVEIEVSDRGPGFPAPLAGRMFDKFVRGEHAGVGGAGLGLAICRAIVEAHGGTIAVEARDGGGARFLIRLPTAGHPPEPGGAPAPAGGDLRD